MPGNSFVNLIQFEDSVPEDLGGGEQGLAHSQMLGALAGEDKDDGRLCLRDQHGVGDDDSRAWSVKERRPEGHLPGPASLYNGLGEEPQGWIILEKVCERCCDFRCGPRG